MLFTIFTFLRWLWPFFMESLFKNATFRSWVASNIKLCTWMLLWLTMLLAFAQMVDLNHRVLRDNAELQHQVVHLTIQHQYATSQLTYNRTLVRSLAEELEWSRRRIKALTPGVVKP